MVTATSLTSATPEIDRFNIAGTSESETMIFPPAIACVKTLPLLKYTAFTLRPYFSQILSRSMTRRRSETKPAPPLWPKIIAPAWGCDVTMRGATIDSSNPKKRASIFFMF
jgi:hypothetical protein